MPQLPKRRTEHLHRGRVSIPQARYFVTINIANRQPLLKPNETQQHILTAMEQLENSGDLINLCACIMPDHTHWLFELGERLTLGRVISKWKRFCPKSVTWQRDFFEHRLRPFEELETYGHYIFLNPYRAQLISVDQGYSGTRFWKPELFQFTESLTSTACPQPEWLAKPVIDPIEKFNQAPNAQP